MLLYMLVVIELFNKKLIADTLRLTLVYISVLYISRT
jgi:hypothetical protein